MKNTLLISIAALILTGCNAMPDIFKAVDDIGTDQAIRVEVDKGAMSKETTVSIGVDVKHDKS